MQEEHCTHRHRIQGCGAGVTEVPLTSYCPNSTIPVFTCDLSAEGIKSIVESMASMLSSLPSQ